MPVSPGCLKLANTVEPVRTPSLGPPSFLPESPLVTVSGTLAPLRVAVSGLLVSISSLVIARVQSISLEDSSAVSRICGPGYLLEGVDEVFLIVKMNASEAPDKSYTLGGNRTYFRRTARDGKTTVFCVPRMDECPQGPAELRRQRCACVGYKNATYTLALNVVPSTDLRDSVIDFVWESSASREKFIRSDSQYVVPPGVERCKWGFLLYISQRNWWAMLMGLAIASNLFLTLIGCATLCFVWRKDKGRVKTKCKLLFHRCFPCLPQGAPNNDDDSSSAGSSAGNASDTSAKGADSNSGSSGGSGATKKTTSVSGPSGKAAP